MPQSGDHIDGISGCVYHAVCIVGVETGDHIVKSLDGLVTLTFDAFHPDVPTAVAGYQ
jgi:hypothetical protein